MQTPQHITSPAGMRTSRLVKLTTSVLAALALTAGSASAAVPDAPWAGSGTAQTSVADGTSGNEAVLKYDVTGFTGKWEFLATAKTARQQPVEWLYEGFHSWAGVTVSIDRFVVRAGKETVTRLTSAGPVWCCTAPSGGFKYAGKTTFDLQPGDKYGFRLAGGNADSARKLTGALRLQIPDVTPPAITPTVTGTLGKNGYYTSDVKVAWNVVEPDGRMAAKGCETRNVIADTAGTTFTCTAQSDGGQSARSVTIKRDTAAPQLTVPATIVKQDAPASGVAVDYATPVRDTVDPKPAVRCSPASGTVFPVGTTKVSCTATDAAGHVTAKDFETIVLEGAAPVTPASPSVTNVTMAGPVTIAAAPQGRAKINAVLAFRFVAGRRTTRLKQLTVKNLPKGSTVTITCKGKSCPKKIKGRAVALKISKTSINVSKLVKGPLKAGTVISIVVSSPDADSATKTVTVRKGKAPQVG